MALKPGKLLKMQMKLTFSKFSTSHKCCFCSVKRFLNYCFKKKKELNETVQMKKKVLAEQFSTDIPYSQATV